MTCDRCHEPITDGDYYMHDTCAVCKECHDTIEDIDTMLLFIKDNPKLVYEYFQETLYSPAPYGTRAGEVIRDIARWSDTCPNPDDHEYMRYTDWATRWS